MHSWNITVRLNLLCVLLLLPLIFMVGLQVQTLSQDLQRLDREVDSLKDMEQVWVSSDPIAQKRARIDELAAQDLILHGHSDAYPLVHSLTSSLLDLAQPPQVWDETQVARLANEGAEALKRSASETGSIPLKTRLLQRANELETLSTAPANHSRVQAEGWWRFTLDDLGAQLEARKRHILTRAAIEVALLLIFVTVALFMAYRLAHGISQRLNALLVVVDRLIRKDTEGVTPYLDDPHEMGRLAKGVEALRQSLKETNEAWDHAQSNATCYALIAENMREVVVLTDREGLILFASPSAAAISDDPEALAGTWVWELFGNADAGRLREDAAQLAETGIARPRCRMRHDGTLWDVLLRPATSEARGLLFVMAPPFGLGRD